MKPAFCPLVCALIAPAICNADSFYLYTINFGATAASAPTSVSYLSEGLLNSGIELVPGQVTVISSPGAGATQHPGVGSDLVTPNTFALSFDEAGSLNWIFQGSTDTITGVGTWDFTLTQLSSGSKVYNPTGDLVVQQLSAPPVIFQYQETWNATSVSALTSYIYDSPIFLQFLPVDPNAIKLISAPGPNAQVYTTVDLFAVGDYQDEGYFVDSAGNAWLMTGAVSPEFDYPGTYNFSSADVKYYLDNVLQTDSSATGSVSVTVITPEPGGTGLMAAASLFFCGLTACIHRRRARRT